MILRRFLSVLLVISSTATQAQHATELTSPDGNYRITLDGMGYSVRFKGRTIVEDSRLGVEIDNRLFESALAVPRGIHEDWCSDLELKSEERTTVDTVWAPLYGENARIRDHYNQLILHYEKGSNGQGTVAEGYDKRKYYAMDIIVRAYDEGIAFRYFFPETANSLFLHVTGEQTTFAMPEGTKAWYEEWAQGPYIKRDLAPYNPPAGDYKAGSKQAPPTGGLRGAAWFESERPLLMQLPEGTYVALLEAAMKDYVRGKFRLAADHVLQVALYGAADLISPYATPWRVIMAADRAVDLINHKDLILNLNAPADTVTSPLGFAASLCEEPSTFNWVRPGKAFRSSQLSKEGIFRSIDFCKEFGIDYVELDAGWYGPEGKVASDAREAASSRDFTMQEVCQYARAKGVGVWVYVNQRALYRQLDELLPLYREWGISGIKFGFVQIGSQQWSTWLHEAVAKCARYGIMVDIHDEYRPTGLSRTFPHLLTQEGIRGNEEMPDAAHNVTLPFTRYLCGPGDYTLCYFNNRVKNTKGHQLAMAAVYYSPLQFLFWYDNPFPKGWDAEELQFWRDCPTVFDESIALDGRPGEYIIQARRAGNEWFIGAMTNTEARTVAIPTDFLPAGKYEVTIYNDDPALDTPTKVSVIQQIVNRKSSNRKLTKPITLQLQASGGAALHFVPAGARAAAATPQPKPAMAQRVTWDYERPLSEDGCSGGYFLRLPKGSLPTGEGEGRGTVKAVLYCHQNMTEEVLFRSASFCRQMDSLGVAMAFIQQGSQNWDVSVKDAAGRSCQERFEQIMQDLARGTEHPELATCPVIPFGHSAQATFPWNFAAWNPERTLCIISYHGDAPRTNLCGYGRANVEWGRTRNIDSIPGLMIEGEYEWWEARVRPALAFRMMYPDSRISFLCDAGKGHFDLCEQTQDYIARFIAKALQDPRPAGGSYYSRWQADGMESTDPHDQFWYQDDEMVALTRARYQETRGKREQYVSAVIGGQLIPYDPDSHIKLKATVRPDAAGEFTIEPVFVNADHKAPSDDHAAVRPRVVLISGAAVQTGEYTFRYDPGYFGFDPKRLWDGITLCIEADGDEVFKSAVRELNIQIK